jgi:hypothetical protein
LKRDQSLVFLLLWGINTNDVLFTNGPGKRFSVALVDIFTIKNFAIAIIASSIGYVIFERLRKQL